MALRVPHFVHYDIKQVRTLADFNFATIFSGEPFVHSLNNFVWHIHVSFLFMRDQTYYIDIIWNLITEFTELDVII